MRKKDPTDSEIHQQGLDALYKRLGITGALRFIRMYYKGSGDHTKEKQLRANDETIDEIMARIEKRRSEEGPIKSKKRLASSSAPASRRKTKKQVSISAAKSSPKA